MLPGAAAMSSRLKAAIEHTRKMAEARVDPGSVEHFTEMLNEATGGRLPRWERHKLMREIVVSDHWRTLLGPCEREVLLAGWPDGVQRRYLQMARIAADETAADDEDRWSRKLRDFGKVSPGIPAVAGKVVFEGSKTLLVGDPKVGKTTLAVAVAAGVVSGRDWLTGEARDPGVVLWIGGANESSGESLVRAVEECRPVPDERVLDGGIVYHEATTSEWVTETLEKQPNPGLKLIVVDTMRALMTSSGDATKSAENSSGEVRALFDEIDEWRRLAPAVGILLIHHGAKADAPRGKKARGSGDYTASVDYVLEMEATGKYSREMFSVGRPGTPRGVWHIERKPDEGYVESKRPQAAKTAKKGEKARRTPNGHAVDDAADIIRGLMKPGEEVPQTELRARYRTARGYAVLEGRHHKTFIQAVEKLRDQGFLAYDGQLSGTGSKQTSITAEQPSE